MQCDCKLSLKCRLGPKLSSCLKIAQKKKAFHYFPQGSLSFQTFIHDSRGVLVKHTDLRIGEVIYEIISQNIPPFGIFPVKGIDFLFFTPVYRPYTELHRASNDASIEASVCILNPVCSPHFKPNLQSTVCSLHFILTDSENYSLSYSVSHFVHLLSSELSVITSTIPNLSVKRKWVCLWWFLALVLRSLMMFMVLFFNYLFKSKFGKLQSHLILKKNINS